MNDSQRRIVVGIGIVVVAVALFVVLSPGGDDDTGTIETTATDPAPQRPESTTTRTPKRDAAPPEPSVPTVVVRDGQPVDGVTPIEVSRGETVRFRVTSDAPEEVHVHGYDVSEDVAPGQPATVSFTADLDGVYEVELEHSAVPIVELTVTP